MTSIPPGIPSLARLEERTGENLEGGPVEVTRPRAPRPLGTNATATPGFLSRAEFAAGYARRTGRDVSRIGYYVAWLSGAGTWPGR